jgi:hypothetical protein
MLPGELRLAHSSGTTCPKFGGFFRHGAFNDRGGRGAAGLEGTSWK